MVDHNQGITRRRILTGSGGMLVAPLPPLPLASVQKLLAVAPPSLFDQAARISTLFAATKKQQKQKIRSFVFANPNHVTSIPEEAIIAAFVDYLPFFLQIAARFRGLRNQIMVGSPERCAEIEEIARRALADKKHLYKEELSRVVDIADRQDLDALSPTLDEDKKNVLHSSIASLQATLHAATDPTDPLYETYADMRYHRYSSGLDCIIDEFGRAGILPANYREQRLGIIEPCLRAIEELAAASASHAPILTADGVRFLTESHPFFMETPSIMGRRYAEHSDCYTILYPGDETCLKPLPEFYLFDDAALREGLADYVSSCICDFLDKNIYGNKSLSRREVHAMAIRYSDAAQKIYHTAFRHYFPDIELRPEDLPGYGTPHFGPEVVDLLADEALLPAEEVTHPLPSLVSRSASAISGDASTSTPMEIPQTPPIKGVLAGPKEEPFEILHSSIGTAPEPVVAALPVHSPKTPPGRILEP